MIQIRIYKKDFSEQLTTLSEQEFTKLSWSRKLHEIGDCRFRVRLDSERATSENLQYFNGIEIVDNGEVVFVGLILKHQVSLDTALIYCRTLDYHLSRRVFEGEYTLDDDVQEVVENILTDINDEEDTGIIIGEKGTVGDVSSTFTDTDAYEMIRRVTKSTGNQFRINSDRTLDVKEEVGSDKTADVILRYEINLVSASTISSLDVEEDGDGITTRAFGKSGDLTTTQEDTELKNKYGIVERAKNFRVANSQSVLDKFTSQELRGELNSPEITISPNAESNLTNFDVGDSVRVIIKNQLVNIDDTFQVLEKRVEYRGRQKKVSVRVNELPIDLLRELSERERRLELLEREV